MMKMICAATVLFASMVASASAGEHASISKSALSSMGLGSMQQLSDNDGLAIRGKGTSASVWGQSTANFFGGNTSTNGYSASAAHNHGSSTAVGASISLTGAGGAVNGNSAFIIVGAAGGSFAYAK